MSIIAKTEAGITPAHAGKSGKHSQRGVAGEDHPRTRGEKASSHDPRTGIIGSPPHTRGKVTKEGGKYMDNRITPAHAGKSYKPYGAKLKLRDHPRTRGEKLRLYLILTSLLGSPPHTRGKVLALSVA